jgi:hypothetical protein
MAGIRDYSHDPGTGAAGRVARTQLSRGYAGRGERSLESSLCPRYGQFHHILTGLGLLDRRAEALVDGFVG